MSCTSTVAVQRTSVVATRNDCERTVAVNTTRLAAVANVQRPYTSFVRTGVPGRDGWAPTIAAVPDGARRVLQVLDWIGGQGPKPATGYIGAAGIVADIANATDFRGGAGQDGEDGADGAGVPAGGALGQVLRKASNADNDTHWHTLTAADVGAATPAALALKLDAAEKGAANGVATLGAGGKIPEGQLPSIAITDVFTVASQSAMLALVAERGDIAVRSDLNKSFALAAEPASTLGNWMELRTPTNAVLSVAGRTGAVTLTTADVGLGSVDNVSAASLRDRATHTGAQAISTVTGLQAEINSIPGTSAQAWTDVKASRAINTDYTNSTGRAIVAHIKCTNAHTVTVGGVVAGEAISVAGAIPPVTVVIPAGATYRCVNGTSIAIWNELR